MKKVILSLLMIGGLMSCSSDDNKNENVDPIFSQEYTPLKDLSELAAGKYQYVGNKIGDQKVGIISEASTSCKKNDFLNVNKSENKELVSMTYGNYTLEQTDNKKECKLIWEYPRIIRNIQLTSVGIINVEVIDEYNRPKTENEKEQYPENESITDYKIHFRGDLEIGFQAGYLRIQDELSDFSKGSQVSGTSYLYFKKQ